MSAVASTAVVERMDRERLRISEIFFSLQGETRTVGLPTTFVRLVGCPLRCKYCDTEYAFRGGRWMTLGEITTEVATFGSRYVTVTGGEPLAQAHCHALLRLLCEENYEVSLETSGALGIGAVDERVVKVLDLKTPGSGEADRNLYANIEHMSPRDQVKFVICDREDYDWARDRLDEYKLPTRCEVLFSPSYGQLAPGVLADWMLSDRLIVRLQIQLHKYLWGDVPGR